MSHEDTRPARRSSQRAGCALCVAFPAEKYPHQSYVVAVAPALSWLLQSPLNSVDFQGPLSHSEWCRSNPNLLLLACDLDDRRLARPHDGVLARHAAAEGALQLGAQRQLGQVG